MLCTFCVQEGGFEGPENGPKQRRINNRLLSYRPQHRRGNVHNSLIVRWFSVFRNCAYGAGDGNRTHVRSLGSLQFNSKNAGLAAFLRFSERLNWKIVENGKWKTATSRWGQTSRKAAVSRLSRAHSGRTKRP